MQSDDRAGAGPAALVADNPDHAGDFEADAEWLAAGVLAERDPEKIYLFPYLDSLAEANHSYLAVSAEAVLKPELRLASPVTLAKADNGAEYLLLARGTAGPGKSWPFTLRGDFALRHCRPRFS